jgi:hypothetical protein
MKPVFALAALAAIGFTSTAFAGDATRTDAWATTSVPPAATAPTAMSDSDMDKITAGAPGSNGNDNWEHGNFFGQGNGTPGNGKGQGDTNANPENGRPVAGPL